MKRVFLCLSISLCLWGTIPCSSEAQLPVIDEAHIVTSKLNLAENVLTAIRMLHQIGNSDAEVRMMIINLIKAISVAHYPLAELEAQLFAISQGAGPRPRSALRLDYFNPNLLATTKALFPGYKPFELPEYPDYYAWNVDTALNTTESIVAQSNANAGLDTDIHYDRAREELLTSNRLSEGNLQAQQTGNAISLFAADGIRRTEKSLAGLINVTSARHAHDMQKEAWGEVMTRTALELAYLEEPPLYNRGVGGTTYVGPYHAGQQGGF